MQGEEAMVTKTRHLVIKREAILILILYLYKNSQMRVPRFIQVLQTQSLGNTVYLSDYCCTGIFATTTCTLSSMVDIATKTKRALVGWTCHLPPWSSHGKTYRGSARLWLSESSKQSDGYNKYDSTTVRPNFCWTSFGVSICKQVDGKIRQDDLLSRMGRLKWGDFEQEMGTYSIQSYEESFNHIKWVPWSNNL